MLSAARSLSLNDLELKYFGVKDLAFNFYQNRLGQLRVPSLQTRAHVGCPN